MFWFEVVLLILMDVLGFLGENCVMNLVKYINIYMKVYINISGYINNIYFWLASLVTSF